MKCLYDIESVEIAGANEREPWERYVKLICEVNMKKLIVLNVLVIVFIVVILKLNTDEFYEQTDIPNSIVKATDKSVEEIFSKIKREDYDNIKLKLKNPPFLGQSQTELNHNMKFLHEILDNKSYEKIGEYYGRVLNSQNVYMTNLPGYNNFMAKIRINNKEFYKYYKIEDGEYDYIVALKLSKDPDWKLTTISVGVSEVFGKNVESWIEQARILESNKYLLPAVLCYQNAEMSTFIPNLNYTNRNELTESKQVLEQSVISLFPIEVETSTGVAEIHQVGFHYNRAKDGIGYTVRYLTSSSEQYEVETIEDEVNLINNYLIENKWLDDQIEYRYIAYVEKPIPANLVDEEELISITIAN